MSDAAAIDFAQLQAERDSALAQQKEALANWNDAITERDQLRLALQEAEQSHLSQMQEWNASLDRIKPLLDEALREREDFRVRLQESQQRVADVNVKHATKTKEINLLVDENKQQQTIIQELAEALRSTEHHLPVDSAAKICVRTALASAAPWLRKEGEK